jgi:hypothetical protein
MPSNNKGSLGILFWESVHTHMGKQFVGRDIFHHAQFKMDITVHAQFKVLVQEEKMGTWKTARHT